MKIGWNDVQTDTAIDNYNEWLLLIAEAKQLGLTVDEIRDFLEKLHIHATG